MPGQTVTELERRFGRLGTEVLERLRSRKAQRGRITPADVEEVAAELRLPRAHVNAAASFYADLGFEPLGSRHVRVCAGTACFAAGGGTQLTELSAALEESESDGADDDPVALEPVYCLGYCYGGPSALDGETPYAGPDLVEQLLGRSERQDPPIPARAEVDPPVILAGISGAGPEPWQVVSEARARDGDTVIDQVLAAGLRGRGGAGFPAARKWAAAAGQDEAPRYVICNGDEGDPGSFVDRLLMERDPDRVLAGIALVAHAIGADRGYVYVRSEYPRARDRLREALEQARAVGHLGASAGFEVEVFEGAGSYVAGEETSLMHSMEGLRGEVMRRPPYPTESGFLHRPTVVNNVETLCAVPWIVANGGEAYAEYGIADSRGTKVVCLNERFRNPGAYEVELGTSLRHIVEEIGGGLREGHTLRALQVGGPLGGFIAPDQLDTPLSFNALREIGADLGHGSLIAIDEGISAMSLLRHIWRFAASESCGTCTPCRIGTKRGHDAIERLAAGEELDLAEHERILETMRCGSLCAFGKSVPGAVRSVARAYAEELPALSDPAAEGHPPPPGESG